MSGSDQVRFLILETSTRVGLVAVARGSEVLGERKLPETRRHARDLAPAVRELLREQQWKPAEVQAVLASRGPGSYTGLRVGLMSARAFAYATGCRLIALDTFAVLAAQVPPEVLEIEIFADAQQDRVYLQRFGRDVGEPFFTARTPLAIRPFADWLQDEDKAQWISGPGLKGKEQRLPVGINLVPEGLWTARADSLLKFGLAKWEQGQADDPEAAEPLYLRPSAAEQQWEQRG